VRADHEEDQNNEVSNDVHTNFKLAKGGGVIGLYDAGEEVIDEISYGNQTNNVSEGYSPTNSTSRIFMTIPTPGRSNLPYSAPQIISIVLRGDTLSMTFSSEPGATYQIEATSKWHGEDENDDDEGDGAWEEVGDEIRAESTTTSVDLNVGTNGVRCLRVGLHP
jgi:hypothetical protein